MLEPSRVSHKQVDDCQPMQDGHHEGRSVVCVEFNPGRDGSICQEDGDT